MRVAHLILTYSSPKQLERTIMKMNHSNFDFYLHVEKKLQIVEYEFLGSLPNVFFIQNRIEVKWADFSTVHAIFSGIKEIINRGACYGFINLLSTNDYPIKSSNYLYQFFVKNAGKEFMSYRDLRNDWKNGLARIENYYLNDWQFQGKDRIETLLNKLLPKRQLPYGYHPYGESMYWMLHPDTAYFVVERIEGDRELQHFLSHCWGSHELTFQTVLLNSPLRSKIINNNYRYNDWLFDSDNCDLTSQEHINMIKSSPALFMSNIELMRHPELFDLIDRLSCE